MPRVKGGIMSHKRKKNVLKDAKGFRWGRKSKYRLAKEALQHAWQYAFRDRRAKKREFRQLWNIQINAAARAQGISYSRLIAAMKKQNIQLDRKVLAQLAQEKPEIFSQVVEEATQ